MRVQSAIVSSLDVVRFTEEGVVLDVERVRHVGQDDVAALAAQAMHVPEVAARQPIVRVEKLPFVNRLRAVRARVRHGVRHRRQRERRRLADVIAWRDGHDLGLQRRRRLVECERLRVEFRLHQHD